MQANPSHNHLNHNIVAGLMCLSRRLQWGLVQTWLSWLRDTLLMCKCICSSVCAQCTFSGGGPQVAVYIIRFLFVSERENKKRLYVKIDMDWGEINNTRKKYSHTACCKKCVCKCTSSLRHVALMLVRQVEYQLSTLTNFPFSADTYNNSNKRNHPHHKTPHWII